jgi:hypothetical protein
MSARLLPKADYLTLKAATRKLVRTCGGTESAASITRVDGPRLSRSGNPQEIMFCAIDVIADLERDAGDAAVTRELARLAGLAAVPLPPALPLAGGVGVGQLGALGKETGEVISKLSQSLADDGAVSADESRRFNLRGEIADAIRLLVTLDQALARIEGGDDE